METYKVTINDEGKCQVENADGESILVEQFLARILLVTRLSAISYVIDDKGFPGLLIQPYRIRLALKRAGISTREELDKLEEHELRGIRSIGEQSVAIILAERLTRRGTTAPSR